MEAGGGLCDGRWAAGVSGAGPAGVVSPWETQCYPLVAMGWEAREGRSQGSESHLGQLTGMGMSVPELVQSVLIQEWGR